MHGQQLAARLAGFAITCVASVGLVALIAVLLARAQ
jgi:hypothetical protein